MDYEQKYLKYKRKYLTLKGGGLMDVLPDLQIKLISNLKYMEEINDMVLIYVPKYRKHDLIKDTDKYNTIYSTAAAISIIDSQKFKKEYVGVEKRNLQPSWYRDNPEFSIIYKNTEYLKQYILLSDEIQKGTVEVDNKHEFKTVEELKNILKTFQKKTFQKGGGLLNVMGWIWNKTWACFYICGLLIPTAVLNIITPVAVFGDLNHKLSDFMDRIVYVSNTEDEIKKKIPDNTQYPLYVEERSAKELAAKELAAAKERANEPAYPQPAYPQPEYDFATA